MPTRVLLAGPNGAGKAPFINTYLRERAQAFEFVDPNEVARHLTPCHPRNGEAVIGDASPRLPPRPEGAACPGDRRLGQDDKGGPELPRHPPTSDSDAPPC